MRSNLYLCFAVLFVVTGLSRAAIIGTNVPSQALTWRRISGIASPYRSAWEHYFQRSTEQLGADQDTFFKEMKAHGIKEATNAPPSRSFNGIPLNRSADWYSSTQACQIADVIVSFQTPAGGWSKRLDMTQRPRVPGEMYTSDNSSRFLIQGDNDAPHDPHWSYVGTFDNDATTTQMRFLAKVIGALPADQSSRYRAAFMHGLDYIFASQFPNGGWPQVWPLQGGYHDAITFNDGAMVHVLELLQNAADGKDEYAFVPSKTRQRAASSVKQGTHCILATQIVVDGRPTVWCQQHDAITLKATSARNYEMPSLCSAESSGIMLFLMKLPHPDRDVVRAVDAAAAWFEKNAIREGDFTNGGAIGRHVLKASSDSPLWPRYSEIGTDRPIFGDRDKTIHNSVEEISAERRTGYGWFSNNPQEAMKYYVKWKEKLNTKPNADN